MRHVTTLFHHQRIDLLTSATPSVSGGQALGSFDFTTRVRKKCVKSLYKICAGHSLLPGSLLFELRDDPMDVALCRGGFADVSKREYCGRDVAVKVLRLRRGSSLQDMTNVGYWWTFIFSYLLSNRMYRL